MASRVSFQLVSKVTFHFSVQFTNQCQHCTLDVANFEMGKDHERDLSVIQHLNMLVQAHDHDLSSEVAIENLRQQLRKPVSQKIMEVAPTIDVNVDNCSTEVAWSTFKINFKVSVDLTEHGGISRLNFASRCRSPVVENQGSSSSRAAACLFTKPSPSSERAYATCSYVVSVN